MSLLRILPLLIQLLENESWALLNYLITQNIGILKVIMTASDIHIFIHRRARHCYSIHLWGVVVYWLAHSLSDP